MVRDFSITRSWVRQLVRAMRVLLIGVLLVIGTALVILYFAGEIGGPVLYLLPGDYRGWAGIRYNDPHCFPLRKEGWYIVIPFDANGRGCTSSSVPGGWRYVRYDYFYPDGKRRKLLGAHEDVWPIGVSGPHAPQIETFFVGSKAEMKAAWAHQHNFRRQMEQ